jgi:hypothetical protein
MLHHRFQLMHALVKHLQVNDTKMKIYGEVQATYVAKKVEWYTLPSVFPRRHEYFSPIRSRTVTRHCSQSLLDNHGI